MPFSIGKQLAAGALVLAAFGVAPSALARSNEVGATWVNRPLVLPKGVLRLEGGPRRPTAGGQVTSGGQLQFHFVEGADDLALMVPGVGLGLTSELEVGVVWPLRFAPDLDLSDISFYGKYSLQEGSVEVAGFGEVLIPIESDPILAAGLPLQIHLSPTLRLDTGALLRIEFGAEAIGTVHTPVALLSQLTQRWGMGLETGLEVVDLERVYMPFGVLGVYSLPSGLGTLGDAFGRIGVADLGSGLDYFRIDVGAEIYFDL